jgi:hypothetical protein
MYRAILPDGDIDCASYEEGENGVVLTSEAGEMIAFVPYQNLVAIINREVEWAEDRSVA